MKKILVCLCFALLSLAHGAWGAEPLFGSESITVEVFEDILYVGVDNFTSVKLTQNGLPVSGKTVYVDDVAYGPTNEYGKIYFTLNPSSRKLIDIVVDEVRYPSKLIALYKDEGVIEISAKDHTGQPLEDFSVYAFSSMLESTVSATGQVARVIAKFGQNDLVLTKNGQNGAPGYYIFQKVYVAAGQINPVILDGSETKAVDLSFKYESNPIVNAEVYFDITDNTWTASALRKNVGFVASSGQHTVYVTPGEYDIFFKGNNSAGELLFLGRRGLDIETDDTKDFHWSAADTGLLNFTTSLDSSASYGGKQITLNKQEINLGRTDLVRISADSYTVDQISVCDNTNESSSFFKKVDGSKDQLAIASSSTVDYSVDLSLVGLQLIDDYGPFFSFSRIHAMISTVSGYQVSSVSGGYSNLNISVTDPKGIKTDYSDNFATISEFFSILYDLPPDAPEGEYEIAASRDLGPLLGNFSGSLKFQVVPIPSVSVSPEVIPKGQAKDVTITVIGSSGSPMVNKIVFLDEVYAGKTDSNGQLVISVKGDISSSPRIRVGSQNYFGFLHIIDFATEGIVEVSATDANSIPLTEFGVQLYAEGYKRWTVSSGSPTVSFVAKAGQALLVLAQKTNDGNPAYYFTKAINITPGETKTVVHFNGEETVHIAMSLQYFRTAMSDTFYI